MSVLSHCLPLLDTACLTLVSFESSCSYFTGPPPTNDFGPAVTVNNACGALTGTIAYTFDIGLCTNLTPTSGPWVPTDSYGPVAVTVPAGLGFTTGHLFMGIPNHASTECFFRVQATLVLDGTTYTWTMYDYICGTS